MSDLLLELGLYTLFNAATAVGAIAVVREAPLVRGWNERGVKPWGCDLCMSFWMTLAIAILGAWGPLRSGWLGFYSWMATFAVTYSWLTRLTPLPSETIDPGIPEESGPPTESPRGPADDAGESE